MQMEVLLIVVQKSPVQSADSVKAARKNLRFGVFKYMIIGDSWTWKIQSLSLSEQERKNFLASKLFATQLTNQQIIPTWLNKPQRGLVCSWELFTRHGFTV